MKTITLLKGLPASGKSTWAREQVAANPGKFKRINKDDLRAMLDASHWSGGNEKFVLALRDHITAAALTDGKHVIIDDTNFHPKHEARMREIAAAHGDVRVEVKMFDTPLDECLARDAKREKPVGEKIIRGMWEQYLKPAPPPAPPHDPMLPDAIILDMDNTAALMGDRGPFDWEKVGEDAVNEPIRKLVRFLPHTTRVVVVSGRDEVCRQQTEDWLARHYGNVHDALLMRPAGDSRNDAIVKRELYEAGIKGKYNILFVLDDRDRVVKMWREIGLTCLQVAPGAF